MTHTAIHPTVTPGQSSPLGATNVDGGVNFSVFSRNAAAIELLLFEREDDPRPSHVIPLDPASGTRFDATKVLLDPYGRGVVVPRSYSREAARHPGDNCATAMKSVVVDPS